MIPLATSDSAAPRRPRGRALEIESLTVSYRRRRGSMRVLTNVSLSIAAGEAYGLVGESGCGKTTVAMAVMRYLPEEAVTEAGRILLSGEDVLEASAARLQAIRGGGMAMVYQDPAGSLNPCLRIGTQLAEVFQQHLRLAPTAARAAACEILTKVRIADAELILRRYPYELSGGQQQRVMVAMALAANPGLLILDEPTTALDTTMEAEVLDLVEVIRREYRTAILLISHNLAVVSRICERVGVLYSGQIVEEGNTEAVFSDPRHPYTLALLRCQPIFGLTKRDCRLHTIPGALPPLGTQLVGCAYAPRCPLVIERCRQQAPASIKLCESRTSRCFLPSAVADIPVERPMSTASVPTVHGAEILSVDALSKRYGVGISGVMALSGLSLKLRRGEVLAVVGESGSGKSTLGKCIAGLIRPSAGKIILEGEEVGSGRDAKRRWLAHKIQMVFQNPDTALNPSHSVNRILWHALEVLDRHRSHREQQRRVAELATSVHLGLQYLTARPRSLSGGLKQRLAIARAFAGSPSLVVCDEPVSALDVSVQAAILNVLVDLQISNGVSYIFISHDLGAVRYLADRIGVMYLGELVETGTADAVFAPPHHPYTEALLSAMPTMGRQASVRPKLQGDMPSIARPPSGCRFHTRCPRYLGDLCKTVAPPWQHNESGNMYRCHIPPDQLMRLQGC